MDAIIRFLTRVFRPVFNPLVAKVRKPVRTFFRLPWILGRKFQRQLKRKLFPRRVTIKDYVRLGRWYIAKRLLLFMSLALMLIVYFVFINPPGFIHQWTNTTNTIHAKSNQEMTYSGKAKVFNEDGVLIYEGGLLDGRYDGHGRLFNDSGVLLYEGEFEKGEKHGQGTLYAPDGTISYKGEFQNEQQSGKGETYHPNGETKYRGEYEHGVVHGEAEEYRLNGQLKYKGEFSQGLYAGQGTLYDADENLQYEGEFQNNQYAGHGTEYFPDGSIKYEGQFLAGYYEGNGQLFRSKNTLLYEGEFKRGKYAGTGTVFYPSGMVEYEGEFLNGTYNGQGKLFDKKGVTLYEGAFVRGDFHGEGEQFDQNGQLQYAGQFKSGSKDGIGELFDDNGLVTYKGFFKEDAVFYPGFLGLSMSQLTDILDEPDVWHCEQDLDVEGPTDPTEHETADGITENGAGDADGEMTDTEEEPEDEQCADPDHLPFELVYHKYELTFTVDVVADRPIGAVTEVYVWGDLAEKLRERTNRKYAKEKAVTVPTPDSAGSHIQFYIDDDYRTTFYYDAATDRLQYAKVTKLKSPQK